ncbi:hypothetical protein PR003_g12743 [Phytophthora rubi]|uniref:Uncharacterized protein n=1 Tax=Phytophthora rubi TaxID=129364 RepID=A0A6A3MQH0_9STRA|nr:hypothetical protein PR002_g9386 [Phytophthora rubi]KAE9035310.1 hypothetical protein PR001_g9357 [Phytophthora rubi]KAE9335971.1 hypothetical protein PR003_g12743 [Phytophthora rubi]
MDPDGVGTCTTSASALPSTSSDGPSRCRAHRANVCKGLLMSRIKAIEAMEGRLERIEKYALKFLNERDELATAIASEKEEAVRLAAVLGVSMRQTGYVVSYSVMLEQCCEAAATGYVVAYSVMLEQCC